MPDRGSPSLPPGLDLPVGTGPAPVTGAAHPSPPTTHVRVAPLPPLVPSPAFTFALISDRTGAARPGVFERGVAALNVLHPSFAVQLGDLIEGYTDDPEVLDAEWAEVDAMLAPLRMPLFHVPGNHDVGTELTRRRWLERYGRLHYHFRHQDVLFVVLNTQDPEYDLDPEAKARLAAKLAAADGDETLTREAYFSEFDWDGTQLYAGLSEEQLVWAEGVLRDHADARWTFFLMHMPLWQGDGHPAYHRLRAALGDRPHTMFAGHVHNYKASEIDGNRYIRLGPTGGVWVFGPDDPGNVDHVTLVTVDADGPHVANLALDGIRDVEGRLV
ncbi:metallophosphoesterase family protein [Yinghuangia seranimata]|uniref:metallophosphoesterase family protein n=1 Tax=Yinghuangia seranimata TaxID=408067 RepID=UPI00248B0A24|nr:metallophosphoesterase [Yinghuangia seranimata]MDI2126347.1 metallophosphoesterase [Yinghuangia seranimata]